MKSVVTPFLDPSYKQVLMKSVVTPFRDPGIGGWLKGDNRTVSATPGASSRIASWIEVELDQSIAEDPRIPGGFGATQSQSHFKFRHDTPEKIAIGSGWYHLEARRLGPCEVFVHIFQTGREPRSNGGLLTLGGLLVPAIDYMYQIRLKQLPNGTVEYTVIGGHDGFPAYEMYMDGNLKYSHLPATTGQTIFSLYGQSDFQLIFKGTLP